MWTYIKRKALATWKEATGIFNRFIRRGTHSIGDEEAREHAIQVNKLGTVIAVLLLIILPIFSIYLTPDHPLMNIGIAVYFVLNVATILLNQSGYHKTAPWMLYLVQSIAIMYFGRLLGALQQLQFMIFFLFVINYQIFGSRKYRYVCNVIALGILAYLQWSYHFETPIVDLNPGDNKLTTFLISCIAITNVFVVIATAQPILKSRERNIQLQKANQLIKMFVAQITHELRSPLNAIGLITKLLKKEIKKDANLKKAEPFADMLLIASNNTRTIVNNVLDLAQIEAGKAEPNTQQTFFVKPFFSKLIEVSKVIAQSRKMQIRLLIDQMPSLITADPLKISHILNNLLSNAIKYGNTRSIITVTIRRVADAEWNIEVRNPSQPIAIEKLNSYFDPFVIGESNFTEGTGLGLHIVKTKATSMGGKVHAISEGNQVAFTVSLPLQVGKTKDLEPEEEEDETADVSNARVLIAEDEAINARALKLSLEAMNCEVVIARNGREMLEKARDKDRPPHIIIMDYHMPLMNGEVALRLLKEDEALKRIPVIVVTGDIFTDSLDKLLAAGADAFISKPVEPGPLRRVLSRHLHQQFEAV